MGSGVGGLWFEPKVWVTLGHACPFRASVSPPCNKRLWETLPSQSKGWGMKLHLSWL